MIGIPTQPPQRQAGQGVPAPAARRGAACLPPPCIAEM